MRGGLGALHGFFQIGDLLRLFFDLCREQFGLLIAHRREFGNAFQFQLGIFFARRPLLDLVAQRHDALFHTLPTFDHVTNFCFQPPNIGVRFVEQALRLVQFIARRVMALAHGFEFGFDVAQTGGLLFQRVHSGLGFGANFQLIRLRFCPFQKPLLVLFQRDIGLQGVVTLGDFGLLFQLFEVGIEFAQNVVHAREIFPRIGQTVFGFPPPFFVFGNARRFF